MDPSIHSPSETMVELQWSRDDVDQVGKTSLVGKLLSRKLVNRNIVKTILHKGWSLKHLMHISDLPNNMFLFSFDEAMNCSRVMDGRPWMVMGSLFPIT